MPTPIGELLARARTIAAEARENGVGPASDDDAASRTSVRTHRLEALRRRSLVPERFENVTISSLEIDAGNRDAIVAARSIAVDGFKQSAAFWGADVGAGKTSIAAALINSAVEHLVPARFLTVVTLIDRMHEASKFGSDEDVTEIVDEFAKTPVLLLDDLGREPVTRRSLPWLYELLNRRWSAGLPLILTTNLSFDDLLDRYADACNRAGEPSSTAEAIVDRLRGMIPDSQWYEVRGQSRRGRV